MLIQKIDSIRRKLDVIEVQVAEHYYTEGFHEIRKALKELRDMATDGNYIEQKRKD